MKCILEFIFETVMEVAMHLNFFFFRLFQMEVLFVHTMDLVQ